MSTLKATNLQHPSAVDPAIVLDADGDVTYAGVHDFSAATVTGAPQGLVHIATETFSGVSSVSLNNVFTSEFDNYRVLINAQTASGTVAFYIRLRASGVDATTANYDVASIYVSTSSTTGPNACAVGATFGQLQGIASTASSYTMDIMTPYLARRTFTMGQWLYGQYFGPNSNMHTLANSYDGFTIYPASSTITGTIRVYGYRNEA